MKVEEGHDGQLLGAVVRPDRVGFGDGDAVVEVQDELHAEEGKEETDAVFDGARGLNRRGAVFALRNIVVVGYDGADKVKRGVDGIGEVIAEVVVSCRGGGADAIVFREVGGVELFLLELISMRLKTSVIVLITYLKRAACSVIQTPVVINIEAHKSQDCEVEQDCPSGHNPRITIKPRTP